MISPPAAFRSTGDLTRLSHLNEQVKQPDNQLIAYRSPVQRDADRRSIANFGKSTRDAELTTRLTRCKFTPRDSNQGESGDATSTRRTTTKLEQNLIAPGASQRSAQAASKQSFPGAETNRKCRFKALAVFESDTDSAAERQSSLGSAYNRTGRLAESTGRNKTLAKQLITRTNYSLTEGGANGDSGPTAQRRRELVARGPQPSWDYSLRVNRMRGNKVDGRVE